MYCGDATIVNTIGKEKRAVALKCRSWTCPDCYPIRKAGLMKQALSGSPDMFLTLTIQCHPGDNANDKAAMLARGWRLLRLRLMRRYKIKSLPFIAVIEAHKSGFPHLHILLRSKFIPWRDLVALWITVTGSRGVFIERLQRRSKAVAYCSKYAGKAAHKFSRCKRYWCSRDYDLRGKRPPKSRPRHGEGWDRVHEPIKRIFQAWTELDWSPTWVSTRECRCTVRLC